MIKALVLAILLAVLGAAWADGPSQTPPAEVEVVTPGASAEFAPTRCTFVCCNLSGRVMRKAASGDPSPAPEAKFSYLASDGSTRPVPLSIDSEGRFRDQVFAVGSRYKLLSSDTPLDANARGNRLELLVSAPGCQARRLRFGPDGKSGDVVLRCSEAQ